LCEEKDPEKVVDTEVSAMNYDSSREAPFSDDDTSRQAAERIEPHVAHLEAIVLQCVRDHGRITCDAVEIALSMKHQTASARLNGLERKGLVRRSGEKAKTRSGREAILWEPAEAPPARAETPAVTPSVGQRQLL
jgi:hypothetical protein